MSIITLTAATYCESDEIISSAAKELNYELVGNEIIDIAAKEFNIPKDKILKAIYKAPASASRVHPDKDKYITSLQLSLIQLFLKDNIAYYGPGGFVLVQGISHVFKVRIIANLENRINTMMKKDGISSKAAEKSIIKSDNELSKWSEFIFKADISDPNFYDLVINLDQIGAPQAIDIIVNAIKSKRFQPMTYSVNCLKDAQLALTLKSKLLDIDPKIMLTVKAGRISIDTVCLKKHSEKRIKQINTVVEVVTDINNIERIRVIEDYLENIISKYS
ncbi:MAG: cytidylate kinase-like family protein [Nitrospirae bacterium]|nr:cytidylate kinase-like family protein [Nitrospirota bacterium]